ncbi:MAG TPA: hypothetical protein VGK34_09780 [Armatimonadota bacterium]|jgi:cell division septum initiation protein DivIVA
MDTLQLLDQLEDVLEGSRKLGRKALFLDVDRVLDVVDEIRQSLPEDVKAADRITREADHIRENARVDATTITDHARADGEKIVEDARAEAERMVDASEIKRMATIQAKEIVASAEEEARSVKSGADSYAREVLTDLDNFVAKVSKTIQHGRDKLEQKASSEI